MNKFEWFKVVKANLSFKMLDLSELGVQKHI